MTKHDYQAALERVKELEYTPEYNAITHALKLAAIVTGEPSEELMCRAAWEGGGDASYQSIFKAMIAEAQREAQRDMALEPTVQHNTKYEG